MVPENSAAEMKLLTATLESVRGMGSSDPPGPIKTSRDTCFFLHGYESPVVTTPPYLLPRLPEGWIPGVLTLPVSVSHPMPASLQEDSSAGRWIGLLKVKQGWLSVVSWPFLPTLLFLGGRCCDSQWRTEDQSGRCVMVGEVLLCSKDCLRL